jgi:hypothetical protein
MKRGRRFAAMLIAGAALITAAAACGGGSDGPKSFTPIVPTSAGGSGNVTPFPTPLLNGDVITSKKGYTATLPDGWHVRANLVQTVDASVDAFFEPLAEGAQVQANISVNFIVIKAKVPRERIDAMKTNTVRQGLNKDIQVSQRQISGMTAEVLSYRFESQQGQQDAVNAAGTPTPKTPFLDKSDYLFSDDHCDWTITTTTLAGERAKYQPVFDAFLDSFKLASG